MGVFGNLEKEAKRAAKKIASKDPVFGSVVEKNLGGRTGRGGVPLEDTEETDAERRRIAAARLRAAQARGRGGILGGSRNLLEESRRGGLVGQPVLSRLPLG